MVIDQQDMGLVLGSRLRALVPVSEWDFRVIMVDQSWLTVSADFLYQVIRSDPMLSPNHYEDEVFDCDDFALALKTKMAFFAQNNKLQTPYAVGFILTKKHAFNFCIEEGGSMALIDTQYDHRPPERDQTKFAEYLGLSVPGNTIQLIYV